MREEERKGSESAYLGRRIRGDVSFLFFLARRVSLTVLSNYSVRSSMTGIVALPSPFDAVEFAVESPQTPKTLVLPSLV